jgi:hypothetical protein
MIRKICILLLTSLIALAVQAQESETAEQQMLKDDLLDELVGEWSMQGTLLGKPVGYTLKATWVLGHQFLLLEMMDVGTPPEYEAAVYIGYDTTNKQYVVHWLDRFGGKASRTLGFGRRDKDTIQLVFDYPSGPLRDTFTFAKDSGSWHLYFEAQTQDGWSEFADYTLTKEE